MGPNGSIQTEDSASHLLLSNDDTPDDKMPVGNPDATPLEAVSSVEFWLLFIVQFIGIGTGLAIINNIG